MLITSLHLQGTWARYACLPSQIPFMGTSPVWSWRGYKARLTGLGIWIRRASADLEGIYYQPNQLPRSLMQHKSHKQHCLTCPHKCRSGDPLCRRNHRNYPYDNGSQIGTQLVPLLVRDPKFGY